MRRCISAALALALGACGSAVDGAATVHGRLFSGIAPWDTDFEFVGSARMSAAGPFRVVLADGDTGTGSPERSDGAPRRSITLTAWPAPQAGTRIALGSTRSLSALAESRAPGFSGWPEPFGGEARLSDGSFAVCPIGGFLELDTAGETPSGRFQLDFATGPGGVVERIEGAFSGALAD